MRSRCHNPKATSYDKYGAKGISVCKAWRESFAQFLNDMGERPPETSLDRIDRRFGYFHANCRWATMRQQIDNRISRADRPAFMHPLLLDENDLRVHAYRQWV